MNGTRLNRYYNNPAIGAAISNLASIFEPPAPADVLAYAQAEKVRKEREGLEALYGMAGDPNADSGAFDRWGAATGMWNPTQGFGARDMADATTRRGQDVSASAQRYGYDRSYQASTENNLRDNQRAGITNIFGPLNPGQVAPAIPEDFMGVLGLPEVGERRGLPPTLSETEMLGAILGDAYERGEVTSADVARGAASDFNVEQVLDPEGRPVIVPRSEAIGQQPFVNPGSQPRPAFGEAVLPDGTRAPVTAGADGVWRTQDGQPIPEGARVLDLAKAQGSDEDIGVTTANVTEGNRRLANVQAGRLLANEIKGIVEQNAGSFGPVGSVQMVAQDIGQMAREVGGALAARGVDAPIDFGEVAAMADSAAGAGDYNPAFRMLRSKVLELAYRKAKMNNPSGEVSRFALQRELEALSQGMVANDASLMASVQAFEDQLNRAEIEAGMLLGRPTAGAPAAPSARPRAVNDAGQVIEWDGTAWVPVQ